MEDVDDVVMVHLLGSVGGGPTGSAGPLSSTGGAPEDVASGAAGGAGRRRGESPDAARARSMGSTVEEVSISRASAPHEPAVSRGPRLDGVRGRGRRA